ncbi:MAG: PQQ-dependent sugar dehydrogenase [Actinomycetota bacterium]|nr:PQQ-dependent sugar dehydrogenase [Actinomycetota bacterium]
MALSARPLLALSLAFGLALTGCSSQPEPPPNAAPTTPTASEPTRSPTKKPRARPFDAARVDLELRKVADGLSAPLAIAHSGDGSGRLFVAEQGGRVVAIDPEGGSVEPFLDLSSKTVPGGEQGLLGLAFHPEWQENGRLFVNYTDEAGDTVIAEYRSDARRAEASSHEVVLTFDQPYPNHNGGQLAFGPDGMLYIGTGDGGSGGDPQDNGQSLQTLLGKILRLDVDAKGDAAYQVPPDNPFVEEADARGEIWALGLRNPWRFSFDRETEELWVADVGQDFLEEVNRAPAGASGLDYGWDEMEGSKCYEPEEDCEREGHEIPVTEYSHDFGCSVTGGYVYRGSAFPDLQGAYVFGDYCSGTIWAVPSDAARGTRPIELLETELNISSFGEGEDGELYLSDLESGQIFQITDL